MFSNTREKRKENDLKLGNSIFHSAVGSGDESLGRYVREHLPNSRRDDLWRLDFRVAVVDDAQYGGLLRKFLEDGEIDSGLGRLDGYLIDRALVQLRQEGVGVGLSQSLPSFDGCVAKSTCEGRSSPRRRPGPR